MSATVHSRTPREPFRAIDGTLASFRVSLSGHSCPSARDVAVRRDASRRTRRGGASSLRAAQRIEVAKQHVSRATGSWSRVALSKRGKDKRQPTADNRPPRFSTFSMFSTAKHSPHTRSPNPVNPVNPVKTPLNTLNARPPSLPASKPPARPRKGASGGERGSAEGGVKIFLKGAFDRLAAGLGRTKPQYLS